MQLKYKRPQYIFSIITGPSIQHDQSTSKMENIDGKVFEKKKKNKQFKSPSPMKISDI